MPLPSTGPISFSQINVELGRPANQQLSLSDPVVRQLAGLLSGVVNISNLRGKAANQSLIEFNLTGGNNSDNTSVGFYNGIFGSVSPQTLSGYVINNCTAYSASFDIVVLTGADRPAWSAATRIVIGGITITGSFTVYNDIKSGNPTGIIFSAAINSTQYNTIRNACLNKTTVVKLLS